MMMHRQNVAPFLKVFDDLGLEIVSAESTGKSHYKITVTQEGNTRFFILPRSSSDVRAIKNFRSQVRRWQRSIQQGQKELELS